MGGMRVRRAAIWSSAVVVVIYFSLLCLSVYAKRFLGTLVAPGLSVGIALTLSGIAIAIGLTGWFVSSADSDD